MAHTQLYLIRHGIAAERGTFSRDADRPLTTEGEAKLYKVAQRLQAMGIWFDLIQTSPLVRAKQTAEILYTAGLSSQVVESTQLAPSGDLHYWLADWQGQLLPARLAIVGHEPNLSEWAELLIFGQVCGRLVMKKAGIIGLNVPLTPPFVGNSTLFWLTPPKLLI